MQKTASKNRKLSNWVAAALILYLFYYSYRYIFKYNAEMTSPTYSDTPLAFQLGKYVLLAIILIGIFFSILNSRIKPVSPVAFLLLILILVQNVYSFVLTRNINDVISLICFCPALLIMSVPDEINVRTIDKIFIFFLHFTIAYEIIQILLYFLIGRLPALGYDTGKIYDVRFGGAWDDPNGFSVLLAFLIPYSFLKFRAVKRFIYVGLLSIFLIMTWSLTGIASFLGICAIILLSKAIHYRNYTTETFIKILIGMLVLMAGIVFIFVWQSDAIFAFIQQKTGSISGHLESFDLSAISPLTLLGISPAPRQMESGAIALIWHGGIIHLLAFYIFGFISIASCCKLIKLIGKQDKNYPLYYAMVCYMGAFMIANLNLPMVYLFSNVGIFALFAAISINNNKTYECALLLRRQTERSCN